MDVNAIKGSVSLVEIAGKDARLTRKGHEYSGLCPIHNEKTPSFAVYRGKDGERFVCFGCGAKGDVIEYIQQTRNVDFKTACEMLGGKDMQTAGERRTLPDRVDKYAGIVLAANAAKIEGKSVKVWNPAFDDNGKPKGWRQVSFAEAFMYAKNLAVLRIETDHGKITPQIAWASTPGGTGWCYLPFPEPRPLYGLVDNAKQVIVVQGEKKARQLRDRFQGKRCIVSASGGDNAVAKTDWEKLTGRDLILWPDADDSGRAAAQYVAERLTGKATRIRIVRVDDKHKGWDAGDLLTEDPQADVLAFLKERMEDHAAPTPPAPVPPPREEPPLPQSVDRAADDDWKAGLEWTEKGALVPRSTHNALSIARHEGRYQGIFKYDSFAKRIIVHRCPPWENPDTFAVRAVQDYDYIRLEADLETKMRLKIPANKCADIVLSVAQLPENTFNPASEYFEGLEWDGVKRLDTWLLNYVSDRNHPMFGRQPDDYLRIVGRKFLCGLAARAINPGCKFDTMIILEGEQYAGKSQVSKIMSTVNGVRYFADGVRDINNKDTIMVMQGKLVIEFDEMNAMRRAEINELKGFLSRDKDMFRPPYGRNDIEAPRQCVFVGTINPEGPYLRDVTGNRRYWPIACRRSLDLAALETIMPLLHAEAAHAVREGEQLWLNREEYAACAAEQEKRVQQDAWADKIEHIISGKSEITADDIMADMSIPVERRSPQVYSRIMQTMVALGWQPCRLTAGLKRPRGFRKTGMLPIPEPVQQQGEGEEIPF